MKRFLILSDGYHDSRVVSDTNGRYSLEGFMKMLCAPHEEAYAVRKVDMEAVWEDDFPDPSIPDEFVKCARNLGFNASFSKYQFNTVFYFAEEI